MLLAMGIAAGIILFGGYGIGAAFAKPIIRMTGVMQILAGGKTNVEVPDLGRSDEIGEMARTVEVFKHNAVEMERMEAEKVEQEARAGQDKHENQQGCTIPQQAVASACDLPGVGNPLPVLAGI